MIRNLLVIGAQRCGTTYLHSLLDAHPDITMARPARPEPKVFCSDELAGMGLQRYTDTYFAHAGNERLLGDKSTSYLEDPKAAARAAEMLGEAHVLVLFRDPVERAISHWRFSTVNGLETRPLETALLENLAGARPWNPGRTSVSPFAYLERGRYADYLGAWTTTFPGTTHVLFLSELLGDEDALGRLWEALGVDPPPGLALPRGAENESPGEAPALTRDLRGTLESYFEASNRALSTQLGRDLPWWDPIPGEE